MCENSQISTKKEIYYLQMIETCGNIFFELCNSVEGYYIKTIIIFKGEELTYKKKIQVIHFSNFDFCHFIN